MRLKILKIMLYVLPVVLCFSFFPTLLIGQNESMNFELSLPLIWLVLYILLSIPDLIELTKTSIKKSKWGLLIGVVSFPLFATLSIIWSSNQLRGFLTAGLIWCITLATLTIPKNMTNKKIKNKIVKISIITSVVVSLVCILQCALDILGAPRTITQLCPGCTSAAFGFPHPNGFMIEPQFMGGLLLAPIVLLCNSLLYNNSKKSQIKHLLALFLVIMTLFLTLSRGAIYAFAIILLLLIVKFFKNKAYTLKIFSTSVLAFLFALNLQGVFTVLGPTKGTYFDGIATSIHQLSLGKIDLRNKNNNDLNGEMSEPAVDAGTTEVVELGNKVEADFNGYIEESTNRRLELAKLSLDIWNDDAKNIFVGTGLGSAGVEMYQKNPAQGTSKEIIQNQYLEILLETGVVGLLLFAVSICSYLKFYEIKFEFFTMSLVVAYAFTLLFFSGLPNALYIYLLPVVWYNLLYDNSKNRLSRIQKRNHKSRS